MTTSVPNFEKAPTYQDVCDPAGIVILDAVGIDTYNQAKVAIDDNGIPVVGIPKELIIADDPKQTTLVSQAGLICEGEDIILEEASEEPYRLEVKLSGSSIVSVINSVVDGEIFTYPPLTPAEEEKLEALPKEMLRSGAINLREYDYAQYYRPKPRLSKGLIYNIP